MYPTNLLFGKRVLWWTLFFLCLIGLSGATSALVGATPDGNVAETPTSAPPKHSPDEQHWAAVFESPRPLAQDWRQYAASDALKPELQTPARIVLESVKAPLTDGNTGILLLTLQADNIQVRETWRVTNAAHAFTVSNNGELYLAVVNKVATFVATVYLIDNFQALNKAYQNLTASAVITVEVMSGLSAEQPPRLTMVAEEVYVFNAYGGNGPYTYTLLANPDANAFTFSNGTLAVNVNATIGEYRFTVAVADAANILVTVAATVEVVSSLSAEQPPRLAVGGVAKEVYVFDAHGGSKPYTYTLLENPDDNAFTFSNGALSVNVSATAGEYRFTVAVADAANRLVTVVATVEVMGLSAEQPPRLAAVEGVAKEVYVFDAHNGTIPYTYTLLENPDTNAFTFSNGTLAVNVNATSGEYCFTVAVADAVNRLVTVAATVEINDRWIFVLGGLNSNRLNDVWLSADGANWVRETANAGWARREGHQALSHNGRLYVLGGLVNNLSRQNDVWSSVDGKNWGRETDDAEWAGRDGHQALSHNGRLYVLGGLVGSNRQNDVWSSADGQNWEEETAHAGWAGRYSHQAVSHNGRLYVLGGYGGGPLNDVWSSADGKSWVLETDDAEWAVRFNHQAVSHQGRLYVLGGIHSNRLNDVWSSADGKSWVLETDDAKWAVRFEHQAVSHNGRLYVLGGYDGSDNLNDVWSSADGKNWGQETAHANWTMRSNHQAVVFPSPLALFGVGERLTVSAGIVANLHTFTAQYGKGGYSYSLGGKIDGFSVNPSGVLATDNAVAGGLYTLTVWVQDGAGDRAQTAVKVFVLYFNLVEVPPLTGLEGFAKVLHIFTTDGGIAGQYTIVAGNTPGYFHLDADSGVLSLLATALEGVYTLSVEVSYSTNSLNRATVAVTVNIGRGQIFVLGGRSPSLSDVWFSGDGKNWRRETDAAGWGKRAEHQALSHNGRLYVLGGNVGGNRQDDVWSSADGKSWVRETPNAEWSRRHRHRALSHNGRLYVLGGYDGSNRNDVWSSADGANWSLEDDAEWAGRFSHQALSHNGRLYVLGGYAGNFSNPLNDVWSSADGKNWSRETDNAEWATRSDHQALSHNGRLYVLGGYDNGSLNDVWSSADGKNWSRETVNANWTGRFGHQALSHSGRLYVLGGNGGGSQNDVWSSADGKNWSQETANADWARRYNHQAVVFPSPLALFGVGERLTVRAGIAAANLHTFTAQYGKGNYTYSLNPVVSGFAVSAGGVLSAGSNATVGEYTLTVWVEDGERNRAQTALRVTVVAQSTAQSQPFSPIISPLRSPIISPSRSSIISPLRSPIISPSASGGGASALALAGGALSLHIIAPPASSLSRPRTPPTSAEGENRI